MIEVDVSLCLVFIILETFLQIIKFWWINNININTELVKCSNHHSPNKYYNITIDLSPLEHKVTQLENYSHSSFKFWFRYVNIFRKIIHYN